MLKLKSLQEVYDEKKLNEMPIAVLGDWDGFKDNKSVHISKRGFDRGLYNELDSFMYDNHSFYVVKESKTYYLGTWGKEFDNDVFVVFVQLQVIERPDLKQIGYKRAIQMSKVETSKNERFKGYASQLYFWFLIRGYVIVSDSVQFDGARKIYDKLSRFSNIKADLVDVVERKILKTDVKIDSGIEDWDFDTDVWSYDFKKSDIRIVLSLK